MTRELAVSWSLRSHYSDDLASLGVGRVGRQGHAICAGRTEVYDDARLRAFGFDERVIARPRPMCKRCAKAGAS